MGFQISRGSDFLRIILYNSINRKLSLKLKLKSVSGKSLRRINSIIKRRFLTRVFQKERRRSIITPPRNPSIRTSIRRPSVSRLVSNFGCRLHFPGSIVPVNLPSGRAYASTACETGTRPSYPHSAPDIGR